MRGNIKSVKTLHKFIHHQRWRFLNPLSKLLIYTDNISDNTSLDTTSLVVWDISSINTGLGGREKKTFPIHYSQPRLIKATFSRKIMRAFSQRQ